MSPRRCRSGERANVLRRLASPTAMHGGFFCVSSMTAWFITPDTSCTLEVPPPSMCVRCYSARLCGGPLRLCGSSSEFLGLRVNKRSAAAWICSSWRWWWGDECALTCEVSGWCEICVVSSFFVVLPMKRATYSSSTCVLVYTFS